MGSSFDSLSAQGQDVLDEAMKAVWAPLRRCGVQDGRRCVQSTKLILIAFSVSVCLAC